MQAKKLFYSPQNSSSSKRGRKSKVENNILLKFRKNTAAVREQQQSANCMIEIDEKP